MTFRAANTSLIFVAIVSYASLAQTNTNHVRVFQFSVSPALGTNGLQPGNFSNAISLNLTSGYSNQNTVFEIAGISNLNQSGTQGLQIAGLANITGANGLAGLNKKDAELKLKSGFNPSLNGIQLSALTNVVIGDVNGAQFSGGVNLSRGALTGVQIAGLSNVVKKYSFGAQLALGWNVSAASMNGVMLAGMMNYTGGELQGTQIAAFNHAGVIFGKNSLAVQDATGLQVGIINNSRKMDGFQIGLINFARNVQGTQIGLLNFYRRGKDPNTRDGTAIGFFNFGEFSYIAVSSDEIFRLNYELATGNSKNSRLVGQTNRKYFVNTLIYSRQAYDRGAWGLGYGAKKMMFNQSATPGMSEYRFVACEIDAVHINSDPGKWTKDISMLGRLKISAGTRLSPKLHDIYFFAGVSMNCYYTRAGNGIAPAFMSSEQRSESHLTQYWPGASLGVMVH